MKNVIVFSIILQLTFPSYFICAKQNLAHSYPAPISLENVQENADDFGMGMIGYWGAVATTLKVGSGFGYFFAPLLLTPVTGAIGASLGVYASGEMKGESGNLNETILGGLKGSVLSIWTWLIPVAGLVVVQPSATTLYAIDGYTRSQENVSESEHQSISHSFSLDPVTSVWQVGEWVGATSDYGDRLNKMAFEKKIAPNRAWILEGYYQNQSRQNTDSNWLMGEILAEAFWQQKVYGASLGFRVYQNPELSGWFGGGGVTVFYSEAADVSGEAHHEDRWGIDSGHGVFVNPFVEGGYRLNLWHRLFIQGSFQVGPTLSFSTSGQHYKMWQETPYQSIFEALSSGIQLRTGFNW